MKWLWRELLTQQTLSDIPKILRERVSKWRERNYKSKYPALAEILDFNWNEEDGKKVPRYLRRAQIEALETYWYLRVVEKTPTMEKLYRDLFGDDVLEPLGIDISKIQPRELTELSRSGNLVNSIFEKVKSDDQFVKKYKLNTVRETLALSYPSYILALAMGAGKTQLIAAIIAMEFSLSLEYHDNFFIKNALVFGPGKTILAAISGDFFNTPFDEILPPRFHKEFIANIKPSITRDKKKKTDRLELDVQEKSSYNIIVTNTEKIRIQKPTGSSDNTLLNLKEKESVEEEVNLRLQIIASLPQLAVFSDEGHHTYGPSLDTGLKKVRKTVDFLAETTSVICVINTTGTPYFKKQMLKDVIYWYSLSEGIKDGILKEVSGNIYSYSPSTKPKDFVALVIKDFYKDYKDVRIYDGARAKIAIYFPQMKDVVKMRPEIEKTLVDMGEDPSNICIVNSDSDDTTKKHFMYEVNDVSNTNRVYLLVNMGTEGWNCPSLFATALARKLMTSNNFVLQAASRCLRQTPGNEKLAKIYLSSENARVLDTQLQDTYGETRAVLTSTQRDMKSDRIIIRKPKITPLELKKTREKVTIKRNKVISLSFTKPQIIAPKITETKHKIKNTLLTKQLLQAYAENVIEIPETQSDIFYIATEFSAVFRIDALRIYDSLLKIYPEGLIPDAHVDELKKQMEKQTIGKLETKKITEVESLSIIRPEGFQKEEINGKMTYFKDISYQAARSHLILKSDEVQSGNGKDFSFHYSPYNFDSRPEKDFLMQMLATINADPDDIEDIYFTGALSSNKQTDFLFQYQNESKAMAEYAPDFLIRKKNGEVLIIEIKMESKRNDTIEGENGLKAKALHNIEKTNKGKVKYEMLFTDSEDIGFDNIKTVKNWVYK